MGKNWTIYSKKADFDAIAKKHNIDKVIARILINRDIAPEDIHGFLHPSRSALNDFMLLKDMDKSLEIINTAISENKKIRIIGDYDIDGICSAYILQTALKKLGARVDYYLPNRVNDGYGVNENIVKSAKTDGIDLIITVDNGIAADEAIALAVELGIQIIVTDHHEIPKDKSGKEMLPCANAVIDPKRRDCQYPFKEICGAVVAWKLVFGLYDLHGLSEKDVMEFLEFAALATVGDIMKLSNENRYIVSLGLKKMRHTDNIGLSTLIEVCGLNGKHINAYHLGYIIGPCLNAGGRLADASLGVKLFTAKDRESAFIIANELKQLNETRKGMTEVATCTAIDVIENNLYINDKVIVVYVPNVHESLCGIIAGRLKEKYTRPCFMLTDGSEYIKGSGRSIPTYPMFDKLMKERDLLAMFGGHPMAAGLSVEKENLEELRKRLNENSGLHDGDLIENIKIDVAMPLRYISEELINELNALEPFGNGNDKPVFAQRQVCVFRQNRIGKNGEYLKLMLKEGDSLIEALYFSEAKDFMSNIKVGDFIDILYYPQLNEFKGKKTIQVVISDYRKSDFAEQG